MGKIEVGVPLGYNLYYTFDATKRTEVATSPILCVVLVIIILIMIVIHIINWH